jgi:hypothetical protein
MPPGVESVSYVGGYNTIFNLDPRGYQVVINSSVVQAAGIPINARITGVAFRRPAERQPFFWPAWPPAQISFAHWDLTLSRSTFSAGSLRHRFNDNIGPDAVLVRSGPLTLPAGFLPGGVAYPGVAPWGGTISFTTPYSYRGGDLLITLHHTGNGVNLSGYVETPDPGISAGTQALGVSSYTQRAAWYTQEVLAMLFTWEPAGPSCGSADFNCDGDAGTDTDIEAFFACIAGSCPALPCTSDADFDGDGDVGTDADIEAFFRVLAGGHC